MAKHDKNFDVNPKNGEWEYMGKNHVHADFKKKAVAKKMDIYQDRHGKKHQFSLASLKRERGMGAKALDRLKKQGKEQGW